PRLIRLVAVEFLIGKGLTVGCSRRYLWASFVVCFDVAPRTGWLSGQTSQFGSADYGKWDADEGFSGGDRGAGGFREDGVGGQAKQETFPKDQSCRGHQ